MEKSKKCQVKGSRIKKENISELLVNVEVECSGKARHMKSTISSDFLRITLFLFFNLLFLNLYKNMDKRDCKLLKGKMYFLFK